ncbi:ABC transporter substrate-binding protein [Caenimonas aquaedulcis]|uniref:ABC transporter substrate-binding protein n=1 Tax=Caenimonas aquaedulcis TaxID=2793270 RepID=A0A931H718_9BURK|nr:ABC transporter substrate-binding protein [Caenimonas aquaedulcis]MBG9389550.1 ABC transporter substrate-binding protein [Caenimonas aquaedulcis]
MLKRRTVLSHSATLAALASVPLAVSQSAMAQGRKDSMTLGMGLEPTGLDPTAGAASAIAEVTQYNVYETLTKINSDGTVTPLLAESWEVSPDLRTYTFKLRKGVKFQNGEPFNAQAVKFSFTRAGGEKSTNKDKRTFASMEAVQAVDDYTVVVINKELDPDFLFLMGQATAIIVEPKSADTNATKPVGTGPYMLESWARGSSVTLAKWDGYRNASAIKLKKVTFRFISDPAAQVAALLAGDLDAFPRVTARGISQFKENPKYQVVIAGSRAKTILAINNKKKPLDDVRVRRAISMAIDRKAVIQGAAEGYGAPIGSHYVPGAFGYVDTTAVNGYNPEKAKALLKEAGVTTPLELTITLPPPPYARQGGEVIASQLAKVGITAKLQNVEWAQWLSNTYGGAHNYDMTIISHVEPFDLGNFDKPDYYWNYSSPKFKDLYNKYKTSPRAADRAKLVGDIQRLLADDCVHAFLYQPQWVTIANKGVKGLWKDMPVFVNDLGAMSWA